MTHLYNDDDRSYMTALAEHAPAEFRAFSKLSASVFGQTDGTIGPLVRELIGIAVAVSKQCGYCIRSHTATAAELGASEAEIAEAIMVAVAIGAGSAATHGALAFKMFESATNAIYEDQSADG